jgi:hypothetical protein
MTTNPDEMIHVFSTFMGFPPDVETPPVCGATLTKAYDRGRHIDRPNCPTCDRILAEHRRMRERDRAW